MNMHVNRRGLLIGAGAGLAAVALGSRAFAARSSTPLSLPPGLQLWTVKDDLARDFDGTLRALRAMGYRRIEAAGWLGKSPAAYRKGIVAAGLDPFACHFSMRDFISLDDKAWTLLAQARDVGVRYVVASSPATSRPMATDKPWNQALADAMTLEDWRRNADAMNVVGKRAKAMGMRFAYHNHAAEFLTLDGIFVFGELDRRTDPALVSFELDLGWVAGGGYDPADMLRRFAPRIELLHVKDMATTERVPGQIAANTQTVPIGKGSIDWAATFAAAADAPIKSWFVEQEPPFAEPALKGLQESIAHLRSLPKA